VRRAGSAPRGTPPSGASGRAGARSGLASAFGWPSPAIRVDRRTPLVLPTLPRHAGRRPAEGPRAGWLLRDAGGPAPFGAPGRHRTQRRLLRPPRARGRHGARHRPGRVLASRPGPALFDPAPRRRRGHAAPPSGPARRARGHPRHRACGRAAARGRRSRGALSARRALVAQGSPRAAGGRGLGAPARGLAAEEGSPALRAGVRASPNGSPWQTCSASAKDSTSTVSCGR
jgi:hypothetical protein